MPDTKHPTADQVLDYLIALIVPPGASRNSGIEHLRQMSGAEIVQGILNHKQNGTDVRGRKL